MRRSLVLRLNGRITAGRCGLLSAVEPGNARRKQEPGDDVVDGQVPVADDEGEAVIEEDAAIEPVVDSERDGEVEGHPEGNGEPTAGTNALEAATKDDGQWQEKESI